MLEHRFPLELFGGLINRGEDRIFQGHDILQFGFQPGVVQQVDHADRAIAAGLVGVAGADAAAGGADFSAARRRLAQLILKFVIRKHDVRVRGNAQVVLDLYALADQRVDFFEEFQGIDDHAVGDHRCALGAEDSGGDQVEGVFFVADFDRVAGIGAAVPADREIEMLGEEIDDFSLALIAPLQADDGGVAQRLGERAHGIRIGERGHADISREKQAKIR